MAMLKLNFRESKELYVKGLVPVSCTSASPDCLLLYIPTRKEQPMCVGCLRYHRVIHLFPLLPTVPVSRCVNVVRVVADYSSQ